MKQEEKIKDLRTKIVLVFMFLISCSSKSTYIIM